LEEGNPIKERETTVRLMFIQSYHERQLDLKLQTRLDFPAPQKTKRRGRDVGTARHASSTRIAASSARLQPQAGLTFGGRGAQPQFGANLKQSCGWPPFHGGTPLVAASHAHPCRIQSTSTCLLCMQSPGAHAPQPTIDRWRRTCPHAAQ
jgi:hypothetical protein